MSDDRLVWVGLAIAVVGLLFGWKKPHWGMKPMVVAGTLTAVALVFSLGPAAPAPGVDEVSAGASSYWPLLVGGAAFLYLWWFAALVFDLVFVWHRYIRHNATDRLMVDRWA